ncbi:MAG: hypothetical protein ACFB12_20420 [Leptolyngbyaceae cyanobacterium]
MEILLGVGIGELLFGLAEAQVQAKLGAADRSYTTELGCRRVQFDELMLELSFEPENENLLGWIEVHNPQATLFGHLLIEKSRQNVLTLLAKKLGNPSEYEDYGSFNTAFYEEQWLELHFEFGRLKSINFGVWYSEDDQPLWPNG